MQQLGGDSLDILGRAQGPRGEVVLRRRRGPGGGVEELVVNGAFAMDSDQVSSEQALGALATGTAPDAAVLIGGLGLGYTAAAVTAQQVGRIDVVEIEECLVEWARQGLTATWSRLVADPRVRLHSCDIAAVLEHGLTDQASWDLVLLDVDNGPDFLIHTDNARLYQPDLLARAVDRLRPGGRLAIWCQGPSPALEAALRGLPGTVDHQVHPVRRGERLLQYSIYVLTGPPSADASPAARPTSRGATEDRRC
jgi:spermidine synthase